MANDTMTLVLSGDIDIESFAVAIAGLNQLIHALHRELQLTSRVEWRVQDLQPGSAIAVIRGISSDVAQVERVVSAYSAVGKALEQNRAIPYSDHVATPARKLAGLVGPKVHYIRFETVDDEATVAGPPSQAPIVPISVSYGAIEGVVQTLTNRGGLRFTLYDQLFDKAVSCYLKEGQEDIMREKWGKRAIVSGRIARDRFTGRPHSIREIRDFRIVTETIVGDYTAARGAVKPAFGSPAPEELIRRLRDAG